MQEANDDLRRELARHKKATNQWLRQVSDGTMAPEAFKVGGDPGARADLTEALERFEKTRHDARVAAFAYMTALPGVTQSDVARMLGISRQLASRFAHEAGG